VVQALLSSQAAVLLVLTQPEPGLHESVVQTLLSSQSGGGPLTQAPPLQVSPAVQAFPSSQAAVLFVFWQPSTGSQESSVQILPSSQFGGAPPTQAPPLQVSPVVQASASSQAAVLFVFWQPSTGSQESSVQGLASSQLGGAPPLQAPPPQVSPVVQASPSSQGSVLLANWQPLAGLQLSSVQELSSSQTTGVPEQTPPAQISATVHALPSSQAAELLVFWQPSTGSQESSVQPFPSSQLGGAPPTQTPPLQVSAVVQASASSQDAVLLVFWHPKAGLQESVVQTLLSSQLGGGPPTQIPALQVSAVVQASPSSQDAVLLTFWQPRTGSQESSVQGLPSSQFGGAPPTQAPPLQVSAVVQALLSSQDAVLLVF
jgi:hypothetical protein